MPAAEAPPSNHHTTPPRPNPPRGRFQTCPYQPNNQTTNKPNPTTPPNRHHPSQSIIPIPPIPVQKPTNQPHTPPTFTPPNHHHPSQSIIPIPPIPVQKPTNQPTTPQPHNPTKPPPPITVHHSNPAHPGSKTNQPHTPPTFTPPNRHHPSQSIIPIPPIPVQNPDLQTIRLPPAHGRKCLIDKRRREAVGAAPKPMDSGLRRNDVSDAGMT